MQNLIVYALREEFDDFSGGSVSLGDGEEYDVAAALEAGDGRIVLGPSPRANEEEEISEAEAIRSRTDAQISEALKNYPALELVEAEDGDEPLSWNDVDVSLPAGPTLTELRARAAELDISGRSSMDKGTLASAIAAKEAELAAAPQNTSVDPNAEEGPEGGTPEDGTSTEGSGD